MQGDRHDQADVGRARIEALCDDVGRWLGPAGALLVAAATVEPSEQLSAGEVLSASYRLDLVEAAPAPGVVWPRTVEGNALDRDAGVVDQLRVSLINHNQFQFKRLGCTFAATPTIIVTSPGRTSPCSGCVRCDWARDLGLG